MRSTDGSIAVPDIALLAFALGITPVAAMVLSYSGNTAFSGAGRRTNHEGGRQDVRVHAVRDHQRGSTGDRVTFEHVIGTKPAWRASTQLLDAVPNGCPDAHGTNRH